jgi:predicted DNA-binding transcriptional regulator AlpA
MTQVLRFKELAAAGIPWSRTHLAALEAAGQFPKRIHIGARTVVWSASEIEAFKHRAAAKR